MSDLKKCPFCGGKARVIFEEEDFPDDSFHNIYCIDCGAQFWITSRTEGIQKWNTRAETEAEKKIEKVREKLESLKNDARMMNEAESIALDYVTDFLLEILEDDNENQRKSD